MMPQQRAAVRQLKQVGCRLTAPTWSRQIALTQPTTSQERDNSRVIALDIPVSSSAISTRDRCAEETVSIVPVAVITYCSFLQRH